MIYKCPKCGSKIRVHSCDRKSTWCDCGECDAAFNNKCKAIEYARLKDSERWRKLSVEKPEYCEGYRRVVCKHSEKIYFCSDFEFDCDVEWRPVYGC